MIEIFGADSPNVIKVLIAMEELGERYERKPLDIMKGEQYTPEFLAISPNNRIPAIIDHNPADGGAPLSLFESGAILLYLADKHGALIPRDARARAEVVAWVMWQMANQGPMVGQAGHFRNYAPQKIPYAIDRYSKEAARIYKVLDTRLAGREYICDEFGVADCASWPWTFFRLHHGIDLKDYPNVQRWYHRMETRPCVMRVMAGKEPPPPVAPDKDALRILFNVDEKYT